MKRFPRDARHAVPMAVVLVWSCLAPAALHAGAGTINCLDGSPARPVPAQGPGGVDLWSGSLQPADPAGLPLPSDRDSTQWNGFSLPSANSGLEFFNAVDIEPDGTRDYLYMAYNSGFQIWDITGGLADSPVKLSHKDGFQNHFFEFQSTPTEFYFLIWDIDAIDPPSGNTLVAVAASRPVGLTLWDTVDKEDPDQLYQDVGLDGHQVVATNIDGRIYAFAGGSDGIHVYDMTRAEQIGSCLDDTSTPGGLCGGSNPVYRGRLSPWPWGRARYLDVLEVGGKHFIAASDEFLFNDLGVEIREITNPAANPPTSTAVLEGLENLSHGVDLFEVDNRYYVAAINFDRLQIYDLTSCLENGTSCNYNNRKLDLATLFADSFAYVEFSESGGRPFLYQGFHTLCSQPPATSDPNFEYLLDLTDIASGQAEDIRGDFYLDPNHVSPQRRIDYWSSYYDQSTDGFTVFSPRQGKFYGPYFYRAALGMFDIHQWTGDAAPTVDIAATSSDRWLSLGIDEWVSLDGDCSAGAGSGWSWSADNGPGVPPTDPDPVIQPLAGSTARVRGDGCGNDTYPAVLCAPRAVEVQASAICGGSSVSSNELSLTLTDPRPFFDQVDIVEEPLDPGPPPQYPVCQVLNFRPLNGAVPGIGGKALTSWVWQVTPTEGGAPTTCSASVQDSGLSCSQTSLTWDTQTVDLGPEIFADGFESGDTTAWGGSRGPALRGGSLDFEVSLTVDNEHFSGFARLAELTLVSLGTLSLDVPAITWQEDLLSPGLYHLTAEAQNATTYRWELEQKNGAGTTVGCEVYTRCEVIETTEADLDYSWENPNPDGEDFRVTVSVANCNEGPLTGEVTVTDVTVVTPGPPPEVTAFAVDDSGPNCDCPGLGVPCTCSPGQVDFLVTVSGSACNQLQVDWQRQGPLADPENLAQLCTGTVAVSHTYAAPVAAGSYVIQPTVTACQNGNCGSSQGLTNSNGLGQLVID